MGINLRRKYKHVVSLGTACDVARNLNRARLRKYSYPFDWWWNMDYGLYLIFEIIKDKFQKFTDLDNIAWGDHYIWPDKKVLIYKSYPLTAYVHQNPLTKPKDFEAICRRSKRFLELLDKNEPILFIFVRSQGSQDVHKFEELQTCDYTEFLEKEAIDFCENLSGLYPNLKFGLLEVYRNKKEVVDKVKFSRDRVEGKNYTIYYDKVVEMTDVTEYMWSEIQDKWDEMLFKYGGYGVFHFIITKYKKFTRAFFGAIKNFTKKFKKR